ncbi:MAG: DNA internalization-related competence protein ComEC/Rec2 [Candidatus Margulisbacteria bacterium]|nr:DNA internalization-related competence protein ComEC/Rec2 [Candidatus Margulisiibacteriota bacterium]
MAAIKKYDLRLFLLVLSLLAGCFAYQVRSLPAANEIGQYVGRGYVSLTGQVDNEPKVKNEQLHFPLKISRPATGTVYVSVPVGEGPLTYGDRVKVRGVVSESVQFANPLLPEGRKVLFLRSFYAEKLGSGGDPLVKLTLWLSGRFNLVLNRILPQKEASLLGSFLLGGNVSPLDDETKERYRQAGLIHLLVVSGTQVSILIGVCLALTKSLGSPISASVAGTSFFNLLLVIMTGAGASIVRAAIMGEVMLVGLLFGREKEIYTSLALSALILLVADASVLFDLGFQLSFLATWALVYIAPLLEKKLPKLLAISLAPLLATSPIIAFNLSQITPGALLSNLLVLPWVECLVILGLATTLLGFVLLPLAQLLGNAIWLALRALDLIATGVAALPGSSFYIAAPSFLLVLGYYAALIALLNGRRRLAAGVCLLALIWHFALAPVGFGPRELTVTFLDVGQGDCALLELPTGRKVLIDGGGTDRPEEEDRIGTKVVMPFLRRKGINKLDLVMLSHPHNDHVGGLNPILARFKVEQVIDNGAVYDLAAYRRFKELIRANKIKYAAGRTGDILDLGGGVKGQLFRPVVGEVNSDSLAMRLVYGQISFLFTGDLEAPGEEQLLTRTLRSTVLKVGHHGSRTSTTDQFLRSVSPRIAVVSVGQGNRYRHPAPATIAKMKNAGIKVYRTDESGAVTISTDGVRLTDEPQRRHPYPTIR